jgi:ubiquinone/menaquinone biosynthesis C-methylase UbiE
VTDAAPSGADRRHYSYRHYASRDVAERFDALRFGGPIGAYLADSQARILKDALGPLEGRRVLDVGTGTGRAAISLAQGGAEVVGVDASPEMLEVARARASAAFVRAVFAPGDAHALDWPDRSFDAAVCLRVIMHTPDWRRVVAELCRVSRWRVVIDFPALGSVACLESVVRRLAATVGAGTEPYRVLAERRVANCIADAGFRVVSVSRQFVLPIAFHKTVDSLPFTLASERSLAAIGLGRLLGSPVTMVAER